MRASFLCLLLGTLSLSGVTVADAGRQDAIPRNVKLPSNDLGHLETPHYFDRRAKARAAGANNGACPCKFTKNGLLTARSELVGFNLTDGEVSASLNKRAPRVQPHQEFVMDQGARHIIWQPQTTTLWTTAVCGCTVLYVIGTQGAAGSHFSPKVSQMPPGTANPNTWLENSVVAEVNGVIAQTQGWTNRGAVLMISDQTPNGGNSPQGHPMPAFLNRIRSTLIAHQIPLNTHTYNQAAVLAGPNFDIWVESTTNHKPTQVHFGTTNLPVA